MWIDQLRSTAPMAPPAVRKKRRHVSSTSSCWTRRPSSERTLTIGPRRYLAMSTECVPLSIRTPPPLIDRIGVPAVAHVDLAAEHVLEKDHLAENPRVHDPLRLDDVVHVAELGRHHQQDIRPVRLGQQLLGLAQGHRERLFAEDVHTEVEEESCDLSVRARRGADDHGVDLVLEQPAIVAIGHGSARIREALRRVLAGIGDGDQPALVHEFQRIDVGLRDAAASDQTEAQAIGRDAAHAPTFCRSFAASRIRPAMNSMCSSS